MGYLILKGFITGLVLSIMLGPAFFLLIETSIKKGFRAAVSFDAGVFTSDIFYILLAFLFYQEIFNLLEGAHIYILKTVGGLIFIFFGWWILRKKKVDDSKDLLIEVDKVDKRGYWMLYIKGFLLNFANPMVIIYWLSVITIGIQSPDEYKTFVDPVIIYLVVIVLTFFSIDLIKITAAKSLRPFVTANLLRHLNRFIGMILIGFGVVLIFQGIIYYVKL